MPFFDDHPRFLETGTTGVNKNRLDARYAAIIADNADAIRGARVLDLGCHDGRWMMAALDAGAAFVTGVEARAEHVAGARSNLEHYGADPSTYALETADGIGFVRGLAPESVDVVLCLGWLNFTLHHMELFSSFAWAGARTLVIDTDVVIANAPIILVTAETTENPGHAIDYLGGHRPTIPGGRPTVEALSIMLTAVGYRMRLYDWKTDWTGEWGSLEDFRKGTRVVLRADRVRT